MVRVLHIREKLFTDGVTAFEMNLMKHCDSSKVVFDFVVYKETDRIKEVENLGGKCFVVTSKKKGIVKFLERLHQLYKIVKKEKYNIIHVDTEISLRVIELFVCKLAGAKVLILHSHNNALNATGKKAKRDIMLHKIFKNFIPLVSTVNFACSEKAAEWLFPKTMLKKDRVTIIPNSIDLERFQYSEEIRKKIRQTMGLEDCVVLGHIGRFSHQKNHIFLIKVFEEFYQKNPNARLVLIGGGELEEKIKQVVKEHKLDSVVLFLGIRKDTEELLSAMDIFVLPSLFEGLPIVGLEVQANGLPMLVSDTVTRQLEVNNNIKFERLEQNIKVWIDDIEELLSLPRIKEQENLKQAGYDIHDLARKMEGLYTKLNGE